MMTKEQFREYIGRRIKNERIAHNLTIVELANALGMTPGFVALIERGKRGATAFTLFNLSKLFGVSVDDILFGVYESQEVIERESKRKKLNGLIYEFSSKEMEFLIDVAKGMRELKEINRKIGAGV